MIIQKGKVILGINQKIIDKDNVILNNYRYQKDMGLPSGPTSKDSYDLVGKCRISNTGIVNSVSGLPFIVNSVTNILGNTYLLSFNADFNETDIIKVDYSDEIWFSYYSLTFYVQTKFDNNTIGLSNNQVKIQMYCITPSTGLTQIIYQGSVNKITVSIYRKKTEVI